MNTQSDSQTKKGRFHGVLIASDFDGTIFSNQSGMPQRNIDAARRFIQEGGTFSVATGRTRVTFAPQYPTIPSNGPTILSNGASVFDFKKEEDVYMICLPETAAKDLEILCKEMPSLAFEAYHQQDIYAHNPNDITDLHMEIVGSQYKQCPIAQMPIPWLKVLIQQERDILMEARERLQKIRPDTYETIFSNPRYLEITTKGVNKGSAVLTVAEDYGIDKEHIYCVGDNENDLSMLALSKIPFAPSSSAQVVLDSKPQLLCSCEEGVLGDVVDYLEKIYPQK